jgi:hypothetical protein
MPISLPEAVTEYSLNGMWNEDYYDKLCSTIIHHVVIISISYNYCSVLYLSLYWVYNTRHYFLLLLGSIDEIYRQASIRDHH